MELLSHRLLSKCNIAYSIGCGRVLFLKCGLMLSGEFANLRSASTFNTQFISLQFGTSLTDYTVVSRKKTRDEIFGEFIGKRFGSKIA